jgi:hypothetical protein
MKCPMGCVDWTEKPIELDDDHETGMAVCSCCGFQYKQKEVE